MSPKGGLPCTWKKFQCQKLIFRSFGTKKMKSGKWPFMTPPSPLTPFNPSLLNQVFLERLTHHQKDALVFAVYLRNKIRLQWAWQICNWALFLFWPTCGQAGLNSFLPVTKNFKLRQRNISRHLNWIETIVPLVSDISHRVPNWKIITVRWFYWHLGWKLDFRG